MNKLVVLDIEVYPNYFLAAFKSLRTNKLVRIDRYGEGVKLSEADRKKLHAILSRKTTFGFNSLNYDIPILKYIIDQNPSTDEIYNVSKRLIEDRGARWKFEKSYDLGRYHFDHFDLIEPAPGVLVSLKGYGTRMGSKKLWELPYDPQKTITADEATNLALYCENDLDVTIDLYNAIENRIKLREALSNQYGIDLRSKSDAQLAETLLTKETGYKGYAPELPSNYTIRYKAPSCVSFESEQLREIHKIIESTPFALAKNGSVKIPPEVRNKKISIGNTVYKIGIGGLHSQEKKLVVKSTARKTLRNADVASYYPSMILEFGWYPKHIGPKFISVYRNFYTTRLKAKQTEKELKEAKQDTLPEYMDAMTFNAGFKIVLNGTFGKLGSKYSKLYSPDLMLNVTLTGQLMLLMLIEQLEKHGIEVMSSNTDGIEYLCDRNKTGLAEAIILDWELETGMTMEHGEYNALYARDVNNYVAVYRNKTKAKGIFAETDLSKGRQCPVVFTAIRQYLLDGTPLEETIRGEKDVNEFVLARRVAGGGVYKGEYLGKMVRWYWGTGGDTINYVTNGNKVPLSDGAVPIMNLPDGNVIPENLDYERYIEYAILNLKSIGVSANA